MSRARYSTMAALGLAVPFTRLYEAGLPVTAVIEQCREKGKNLWVDWIWCYVIDRWFDGEQPTPTAVLMSGTGIAAPNKPDKAGGE